MRRQEREIRNPSDIQDILRRNNLAVVSMLDGSRPYGVMTNYAFSLEDGRVVLYFHGASEGRKADCLRRNPAVSVFVNDAQTTELVGYGTEACRWTMRYASVVLEGSMRILEDPEEKRDAMRRFMRHYTDRDVVLPDAALRATMVMKLVPDAISGKRNPPA